MVGAGGSIQRNQRSLNSNSDAGQARFSSVQRLWIDLDLTLHVTVSSQCWPRAVYAELVLNRLGPLVMRINY